MDDFHTPVLLKEIIENLKVKKNEEYIDATIGGGGHTVEILKRGGRVLGIDVDREAIEYVSRIWKIDSGKWKIEEGNLILAKGNFRDIDKIAKLQGFEKVAGIIFDLGVSSHQLEKEERGFSFQNLGPLDMRMDQDLSVRAIDLLKVLTRRQLYEIFTKFGEENQAFAISKRIDSARKIKPIETTKDLVGIIGNSKHKGIHNATKVFQALRIAVNDELNNLKEALPKAVRLLKGNGRIEVISFHSLEDRIVKREFLNFEEKKLGKIITKKPILPSEDEIKRNARSRSAKLRIFEYI